MDSVVDLMHKKYSNKSINYYLRVGPSTTYALYPTNDIAALRKKSFVAARFCEGGHICTLPRECCTQGCCPPPYQSGGPRQLPPASEHVLNLFFISHWFFWCVVVAVILALLCAYSLWKKRRTLCGWGFTEHHVQSEGDSAGSCYAPPQYSRCNSFHHPPPPYTEVTSKPDLYPLVFTCNSENGKNASSYLMVQYFRNYIVRPHAASLSAASTVDSLSSSFICNINEANTLVPPPYSRAASPEIGYSNNFHQHYVLPRSASQLVSMQPNGAQETTNLTMQQAYDQRNSLYTTVAEHTPFEQHMMPADTYRDHDFGRECEREPHSTSFMHVVNGETRQQNYMANSNSSISDIFVNGGSNNNNVCHVMNTIADLNTTTATSSPDIMLQTNVNAACIQTNPLHRLNRHSVSFSSHSPVHHSRHSMEGTRSLVAENVRVHDNVNMRRQDVHMLRRSLESCRQLLQCQKKPNHNNIFHSLENEDLHNEQLAIQAQSLINSLASIEGATGEVKEILEQIRQLEEHVNLEQLFVNQSMLESTESAAKRHSSADNNLQNCMAMPTTQQQQKHASSPSVTQRPMNQAKTTNAHHQQQQQTPLNYANKKKYYSSKPNKSLYIPMIASTGQGQATNRCLLKSPVSNVIGSGFFTNRGRGRKVWVSRSAPTTPGTCEVTTFGDDSPLLFNEHEEDQEAELEHV